LEESLERPASPVRVKICGITRLADAVAALEAGADYLGFILYPPSPRAVTPATVTQITTGLRQHPALTGLFALPDRPLLVGVFVNKPAEDVARVLDLCGLDVAQLSGDESPQIITDPASPLYGRTYKALRPRSIEEAITQSENYTNLAPRPGPRLLIDSPHDRLYGGTGQTGDWAIAARLRSMCSGLMVAGGLKPENVAEAVASARPFAVDVASGVEARPGVKDYDRVRAFIANAKSA
jgi:phosphoribosylanthranilate isomerase